MKFCTNCGAKFDGAGNFCALCGAPRATPSTDAIDAPVVQSFTATATASSASVHRAAPAVPAPAFSVPTSTVMAAAPVGSERPGRLFSRIAAWIVDLLLGGLTATILGLLAAAIQSPDDGPLMGLVILATWLFYFAAQESSSAQATLGKRAVGLKVVRRDGNTMGFWQALGRIVVKTLSAMLLAGLGNAVAVFNGERRALHDYTAGTLVLTRR